MRRQGVNAADRAKAARELLCVYERLAAHAEHLLRALLAGSPLAPWQRLPEDDAIDRSGLFQWFYHSHGAEDERGEAEHGHFHLFARRPLWEQLADSDEEDEFAALAESDHDAEARHLLGISMGPKGVPVGLFTVAPRVTGDAALGAGATLEALRRVELDTGYPLIDRLIASVVDLCLPEIEAILARRDDALRAALRAGAQPPEVLSELPLDLDAKIAAAFRATSRARRPARPGPTRRSPARERGGTSAGARAR
jgi:hypothetical protein